MWRPGGRGCCWSGGSFTFTSFSLKFTLLLSSGRLVWNTNHLCPLPAYPTVAPELALFGIITVHVFSGGTPAPCRRKSFLCVSVQRPSANSSVLALVSQAEPGSGPLSTGTFWSPSYSRGRTLTPSPPSRLHRQPTTLPSVQPLARGAGQPSCHRSDMGGGGPADGSGCRSAGLPVWRHLAMVAWAKSLIFLYFCKKLSKNWEAS